jgi:RNA polymerase primary sigma factor
MAQSQTEGSRGTAPGQQSPEIQLLIAQGKQRGYVTQEELSKAMPTPEDEAEVFAALDAAGVLIGDPSEIAVEAEEEIVAVQDTALDETLSDALLGDSVRLYLREIGQVPLLTGEQERTLAQAIKDGLEAEEELRKFPDAPQAQLTDLRRKIAIADDSRKKMAAANLRLVVSIAKRYRDRGLPLLDLIQEGSLGLLRAIEKFDVKKGFKFSTYATWWIKQALSRALADQSRLVRLPVHLGETLNRIQAARRQLTQTLGRDPLDSELSVALGMSEDKLRELRRTAQDPVSLATPVGEEADSTLADFIPDPHALDADDAAASGMLRQQIATALDQLTERERRVLELRYGLSDGQPRTLEEVGRAFGVTRERVRQIEVKALRKLRHPRLGKLLKDYLDQI